MIDRRLAHYRITAKLGAGGMGEVYRAEDTKLGRAVALKVLPEAMASHPDRLSRLDLRRGAVEVVGLALNRRQLCPKKQYSVPATMVRPTRSSSQRGR